MKNDVIHFLRAAVAVTVLTSSIAQGAETLALSQAEELAIKNHPRITAAELNALASGEVVRENRSAFFPVVTANATAAGTSGDNTRIAAGSLNNPLILERNAEGVNVTQIITDFGRTANLTASAKLQARAQQANSLATRADILLQVQAAYFRTLQAQSVLDVARQTVTNRQTVFEQVSTYASNQLKSGLDVSFAQVDLDQGRLLMAGADRDVATAFTRLNNLMGERDQKEYQLLDVPVPTNLPSDDLQLVEEALRDRPDLVELRFERDAAERFARAENDLNYPTVSAVGAAGILPVHDAQLKANYAAAGVNLSLPIFDGFLFSARSKEAQLKARAAAENLRDLENNVARDVRVAALDYRYAAERLDLTAHLLESANQAYDLADARYRAGSSSIVELSQAQLNKTEAQIAQAQARYQFQIQNAVVTFEAGRLR